MTRSGAAVECEKRECIVPVLSGLRLFQGPINEPRIRPSVSGVEPSPVCAGEGERGGADRLLCVCALVSPRRKDNGRRRSGDGLNEWLVSCRRDAKGEGGRVISLYGLLLTV